MASCFQTKAKGPKETKRGQGARGGQKGTKEVKRGSKGGQQRVKRGQNGPIYNLNNSKDLVC